MNKIALVILVALFASITLADDFKTTDGKEYKDATVRRVEPDGIVVTTKSGISKLYFTELPKDVQERFHYDPEKATAYSAEQNAALQQARKQQEEALRQKTEATAQSQYLPQQESAKASAGNQQDKVQAVRALQVRYRELEHQEDALLLQIGEAERRHRGDSFRSQLPFLKSHLKDIRHEKDKVSQQLEQAQRH